MRSLLLGLHPGDPLISDSAIRGSGTRFALLALTRPSGVLEVVRIVVELRDGDRMRELSQTAVAATSGAAVEMVV
jgi:hypothetical protein